MPLKREYLFDTTVLSNFAAASRLDLLRRRYSDTGYTTAEVSDELRQGVRAGYRYLEEAVAQLEPLGPDGWLKILASQSPAEFRYRAQFDLLLGPGEASCLALAASRGMILATDDLAARRLAREHNVQLTGSIGILIASVREDAIALAEANTILAGMIERRYRSPVDSLDDLV